MAGKGVAGAFFGILVLVLVFIAFFGVNWYHVDDQVEFLGFKSEIDTSYGLHEAGDAKYSDWEGDSKAADAATVSKYILIVGIVLAIIFVIFAFLADMEKMKGSLTMLIGLIAGMIILVGVAYFAIGVPKGISDDWGGAELKGNFGPMFLLAANGAIFMFIGAVIAFGAPMEFSIPPVKQVVTILIVVILCEGIISYGVIKEDPEIKHYNPYEAGATNLFIFSEALEKADHTTRTIVSSPVILKGIKEPEHTCYIVVGVDRDYRPEEISVIEKFVKEDGGKAIIMDDFGSPNALSERFGVFFYGKTLWDDINFTGPEGVKNISFPHFEAHLGKLDLDIVMNAPTGLTSVNPNVVYIANGSEKSYVDLDGNNRVNIGDKKGFIPVVLEVQYNHTEENKGKVVFISDANIATDDMIDQKENKRFLIGLVNRLMRDERQKQHDGLILFDESRHQHSPSQELLYKNIETIAIMTSWFWPVVGTLAGMLVIFGLVVYSSRDKDSWIHRFDVSTFTRRADPPDKLRDQLDRARAAFMLKVRMTYSYSDEEMTALQQDQLRAMIKDSDLVELALNPNRSWTQQELRVLLQRVKDWGGD